MIHKIKIISVQLSLTKPGLEASVPSKSMSRGGANLSEVDRNPVLRIPLSILPIINSYWCF